MFIRALDVRAFHLSCVNPRNSREGVHLGQQLFGSYTHLVDYGYFVQFFPLQPIFTVCRCNAERAAHSTHQVSKIAWSSVETYSPRRTPRERSRKSTHDHNFIKSPTNRILDDNPGTDGTFPDFLSCGSRRSREGGDCGIPPLRKRPRKDGAPGCSAR